MILLDSSCSCNAQEIEGVAKVQQELDSRMQESNTLREGLISALLRLERLKDASSVGGWDGEEAEAVSLDSYNYARWFLSMVPLGVIAPDPGIDINGHMTLEWRRPDGRLLSLTFDDQGNIHCICFLGIDKIYMMRAASWGFSDKLKDLLEGVIRN